MDKWKKVSHKVEANVIHTFDKILLHENGSHSIGCPYQVDYGSQYWLPKMTVVYYMSLPEYPEDFIVPDLNASGSDTGK